MSYIEQRAGACFTVDKRYPGEIQAAGELPSDCAREYVLQPNRNPRSKLQLSQPTISIVTPSFNQGRYLERTICSVLDQGYPNLEYIIIDGGSTDGSQDIIRRYEERISYWVSEPDLGQTDAINKGFDRAKGEIFAWLNSDDTYQPGALEQAVQFLGSNPAIGMVYGSAMYIDDNDQPIARYPARHTDYHGLRRGVNTISQQAMFFRSKLWCMVRPLDPNFYYAMDYDLWVRIASISPIRWHDRYWANFRLQEGSKSMREAYRCWPEVVKVHFRDGGSVFSILYLKYILRRILEPIVPLRLAYRKLKYRLTQG
ncbi:MAG: glycosyltransferase [Anaerolineales bacterium]|nr:MAG: glycosyltransferase [Anaerolineales bacterium]